MGGSSTGKTLAYLLRGWEERTDDAELEDSSWRFSLEDPHTGDRHGFASLAQLMAALTRRMAEKEEEQ